MRGLNQEQKSEQHAADVGYAVCVDCDCQLVSLGGCYTKQTKTCESLAQVRIATVLLPSPRIWAAIASGFGMENHETANPARSGNPRYLFYALGALQNQSIMIWCISHSQGITRCVNVAGK